MATVSAFGFSGTDHPNTLFEGYVNEYFNRRAARQAAELNYGMAQRYAENSPSWTREGLERAGYNPMLALSGDLSTFGNGNIPIESGAPKSLANSHSGFSASEFEAEKAARKLVKNEVKQSDSDTRLSLLANEVDYQKLLAEADVYGLDLNDDVDDRRTRPEWFGFFDNASGEWKHLQYGPVPENRFKQTFRKNIERGGYEDSRGHAIYEDALRAAGVISGAAQNFGSAYRAFRGGQRRSRIRK